MAQERTQVSLPNDRESLVSIILGAVVVVIICALIFRYLRSRNANSVATASPTPMESPSPVVIENLPTEVNTEKNENGEDTPTGLPAQYVVKKGDSTSKLSQAFYGTTMNAVDIEGANNLKHNQGLTIGMMLTIPRAAVRTSMASPAATPSANWTQTNGQMPASQVGGPEKGDDSAAQKALQQ